MDLETRLPGNIEVAVLKIELESPDVGKIARQISRRLLSDIVLPDNTFGDTQAAEWIRKKIGETNVVNLVYVSEAALSYPTPEYDHATSTLRGASEQKELQAAARVASEELRVLAAKWDIPSRSLLVDAILNLTAGLNSLEETV